jgi:3alpha(or 20beta)-hydroxysteroid dehydrogenase
MRLDGKVAIVSGGARGMGAAHARAIVAEGGRVVIGDVLDEEGAALAAELGPAARFVHLDVRDASEWEDAVAAALDAFGVLNVLINNAGVISSAPIDRVTDEEWDRVIGINLTGTFRGIRAAVPALVAGAPSSIVNVSSTAGLKGMAHIAAYTASKFGVRGLTKSAAVELGDRGVRVNSIHPGNVRTDMLTRSGPFPLVPLGRAGEATEISALVVFLASDESSFSTGGEFVADGGETAGVVGDRRRDD